MSDFDDESVAVPREGAQTEGDIEGVNPKSESRSTKRTLITGIITTEMGREMTEIQESVTRFK
jgi:hypothetical protein